VQEDEKWATAALRIHSQNLAADEITTALGSEPTRTAAKGEPMSPRNLKSALFKEHLWLLSSTIAKTKPLQDHISQLLEFIEQKLPVLKELGKNCEMDLFCGYSSGNGQGSFVLEAELLKRITVLPIDIVFDIYSTPPSED
jgi:hypothetical protein